MLLKKVAGNPAKAEENFRLMRTHGIKPDITAVEAEIESSKNFETLDNSDETNHVKVYGVIITL